MRRGGSWIAFFSGMVVGALTAVLLVPESGEETRKRLKETGLQRLKELEQELHRLREEVRERFAQLRKGEEGVDEGEGRENGGEAGMEEVAEAASETPDEQETEA